MNSMKEFNVYTEIPIDKITSKQYISAIDLGWIKAGRLISSFAVDW